MTLLARTLAGQAVEIAIEGENFAAVTPSTETSTALPWIAPGLIDIQVNGFGGVDFNRPLASPEAWQQATHQLYAHGCTGFLVTLITNREEGYRELLPPLAQQIGRDPRNALGFHLEGPWLNPDPAHRGAHRAEWMQKPSRRLLDEWRALAGDSIKLITLAPETDPDAALALIRSEPGIRFFIGHSGAMGETLTHAVEAGAIGWTHLGNAAPAIAPKFENVIFHALAQPHLFASLIPDGIHLPPHAFCALALALDQTAPHSRLLLTTDAMAGAAAGRTGRFTLGEVEAEVAADGSARLPGTGRLAGSTLTPFEGVLRAMAMAGLPLERAWAAFSERPAALLGLRHAIASGHAADFCLLASESPPRLLATWQRGHCVYQA